MIIQLQPVLGTYGLLWLQGHISDEELFLYGRTETKLFDSYLWLKELRGGSTAFRIMMSKAARMTPWLRQGMIFRSTIANVEAIAYRMGATPYTRDNIGTRFNLAPSLLKVWGYRYGVKTGLDSQETQASCKQRLAYKAREFTEAIREA